MKQVYYYVDDPDNMNGNFKPLEDQVSTPITSCKSKENVEIEPFSEKPFFHLFMQKSHVSSPYQLVIPAKFTPKLPSKTTPVILLRGERSWKTSYQGNHPTHKRFDPKWRVFVEDTKLKIGDTCLFELMECEDKLIKFKVQILRGDFPPALLDKQVGSCMNPVVIEDD